MQRNSRLQLILVILIALLVGYYLGVNKINFDWKNYHPNVSIQTKEPPAGVSNVDFAQFWNVWQKLQNSYYDKTKLDPQKMLNGAISGMVQSLEDPFTVYLPPTQNENFKQGLAGQFQGIGAELGVKENKIVVISPLNGSPALKAGVRAGDLILEVDGKSTSSWTLSQAVEKIRGPQGTAVELTIMHKEKEAPVKIKIVRDVITVKSVDYYIKKAGDIESIKVDSVFSNEKVAYISLSQFGDNTNQEWLSLINKLSLELEKQQEVKGIVFDLRNNPGGYLSDATFIASEFLPQGSTVVIEEDGPGEQTNLSANRKGLLTEIPLIVLINKGSASASEIVAGALRDHDRAKLLGETSFGKGTIQQAEDLGGGAGLHVTIAKWLTPNGTWVNGKGLAPDIKVDFNAKDLSRDSQLERAVLELIK